MRVTYDAESNAAYVYLVDSIAPGEAEAQHVISDDLIIDYDRYGKLLGFEILNARRILRPSVISQAARMVEAKA